MLRIHSLISAALMFIAPAVSGAMATTSAPAPAVHAPASTTASAPASTTASTAAVAEAATAPAPHTVTLVNRTKETIWVGSGSNRNEPDGDSAWLTGLPKLAPGQKATLTIPENKAPFHWRGRFFAREGCSGKSGSTFHCAVGDCGKYAGRCEKNLDQDPVSLAEFNFDRKDALAPWYDVSYVDAVSVPITIAPVGAKTPTANGACSQQGCSQPLLPYCPKADRKYNKAGKLILCVNPNRDAVTSYSKAIGQHCPKAYAWSKQDTVGGNQTMRDCAHCRGFNVTFW